MLNTHTLIDQQVFLTVFLNQACGGRMPDFLVLLLSKDVCMLVCVCVCPPLRLLITSGVMWCNIDPI